MSIDIRKAKRDIIIGVVLLSLALLNFAYTRYRIEKEKRSILDTYAATVLYPGQGGTGLSSYATGDILQATDSSTLGKITVGTDGQTLVSNGTNPGWSSDLRFTNATGTNVTTTNIGITGRILVSNKDVCLEDGTNCSASATTSWYGPLEWSNATGTNTTSTNMHVSGNFTLDGLVTGDMLYFNGSKLSRIPPNTSTSTQYLTQSESLEPHWQSVATQGSYTYFFNQTSSSPITYNTMGAFDNTTIKSYTFTSISASTTVRTFITASSTPDLTTIPAGIWTFHIDATKSAVAGQKDLNLYADVFKFDGGTETLLFKTSLSADVTETNTSNPGEISIDSAQNAIPLSATDRIGVRIYAVPSGTGTDPSGAIYIDGPTQSRIEFPYSTIEASNFVPYSGALYSLDMGTRGITMANSTTTNATTTSLYSSGLSQLNDITFSNATGTSINVTGNSFSGRFLGTASGSSSPVYSVKNDLSTGIYMNTNVVGLSVATQVKLSVSPSNEVKTVSVVPMTDAQRYSGSASFRWNETHSVGLNFTNATGTNVTSTNIYTTNAFATNSVITYSTSTEIEATGGISLGGVRLTSWPAGSTTSSWYGAIEWKNATGTNTTSTNLYATNLFGSQFSVTNASSTSFYASGLSSLSTISFTNATGTGIYASNVRGIDFTITNATATSLYVSGLSALSSLTFTGASGTSLYTSGLANLTSAYIGSLGLAANANITVGGVNASSTFYMSGASGLIGTTAPLPTSTAIVASNVPSQVYAFNASTTNCVYWVPFALRGAWDAALLKPIVSWISTSGTGDVVWRLRAQSEADDTYVGAPFSGVASYATSTAGLGYFRQRENMDALTVENATAGIGIRFEMCRIGGSEGDTLGGDAYLELVEGEYGLGSFSD